MSGAFLRPLLLGFLLFSTSIVPLERAWAGAQGGLSPGRTPATGAMVSDDFHGTELDTTVWRFDDPVGDVLLWMTGTNAVVSIPGGTNYDMRGAEIRAPRLMQAAPDTDFDVECKFDSKGAWWYQGQGLLFVEDEDTYLRFQLVFGAGVVRVYAAYEDAGVRTTKLDQAVAVSPPYLRVTRAGDVWTYRYSYDALNWTTAVSFAQNMTLTEAGVYFSSAPTSAESIWDTPAFVGNVDYFFNRAAPIDPEDGGEPSVPTPPVIELWGGDRQAFGSLGVPQEWVNILGRVWDTEAVDSLFYRLNGGPANALTMGPNITRLPGVGDFNIEIDYRDLIPGPNDVVITAIDALGERRDTTVTVGYTQDIVWAMPSVVRFETAAAIPEVAHIVDGRWSLVPGEGVRVDANAVGYDRLLVLGDYRWETDYEVLLPMTIHAGSLGGLPGIGLGLGWQGHTGEAQPRVDAPFQALTWVRDFPANPTLIIEQPGIEKAAGYPAVEADVRYLMRTRSESLGTGMSRVRTKLWADGTPEPADWQLAADVPTRAGSVILVAHRAIATFGDVEITPVGDATAIGPGTGVSPLVVRRSYPNPFRGRVSIEYGVPAATDVEIAVYDAAGRKVYEDRVSKAPAGRNTYVFRGTDSKGNALPSGVYFFRLKAGGGEATKKIVIVR